MTETLEITCAGVEDSNSFGVYSASWRETFKEDTVEPTVLNDEPEINKYHIEDLEGNELEKNDIDVDEEIMLVIESSNAVGKTFKFNLDDQKLDYEHNGIKLENDTLEVQITNDIESIPLKAILQEN